MRTGILGGTFDPIHQGHVSIARRALEAFGLDSVIFMVAHVPPHKQGQPQAGACQRFAMAALETAAHPELRVSDWELLRSGPSYTVDTLAAWRVSHPESDLCFIAGMDSLAEIHLWKDYAKLLTEYCFVFVQRPGMEVDLESSALPGDLKKRLTLIQENEPRPEIEPGRSFILPSHHPPASSTAIRRALSERTPVGSALLSPQVLNHIRKYRLYERSQPEAG